MMFMISFILVGFSLGFDNDTIGSFFWGLG